MESTSARPAGYEQKHHLEQGDPNLNDKTKPMQSSQSQVRLPHVHLTKEEMNILEECNTESFWHRSVPLSFAFGGTTAYLVKTGHLKPHPRYGATLKTLGKQIESCAVFVGYVLGKLSYRTTCKQKILDKIPNSNLAQTIRKSQGIQAVFDSDSTGVEFGPGFTDQRARMRETYSSIDVAPDSRAQDLKELDDNLRPTMDREVKTPDDVTTHSQRTLTYQELRQKHREDYNRSPAPFPSSPVRQQQYPVQHDSGSAGAPESSSGVSSPSVWDKHPPNSQEGSYGSTRGQKKNVYGDTWDG